MKARVRNTFRDKLTRVLHRKGTEIEISEERFAEINGTDAGFLVEAVEPEEKQAAAPKKPAAAKNKPK